MQTLRPRSNACERAGHGQGKGCGTRAAARRAGETLPPHSHASPPTHRVRGDDRGSRRRRRGPPQGSGRRRVGDARGAVRPRFPLLTLPMADFGPRDTAAVRGIGAHRRQAAHMARLQHNRRGHNRPDTLDRQELLVSGRGLQTLHDGFFQGIHLVVQTVQE